MLKSRYAFFSCEKNASIYSTFNDLPVTSVSCFIPLMSNVFGVHKITDFVNIKLKLAFFPKCVCFGYLFVLQSQFKLDVLQCLIIDVTGYRLNISYSFIVVQASSYSDMVECSPLDKTVPSSIPC